MSNADIAELLAVAYALHCAECDVAERQPILWRDFADLYKNHIQDFRHFMKVDSGDRDRSLNG